MDDLLTFGELHNPADIRGQGTDVLPEIADVLFADDAFDAYVFAIGLPAVGEDADAIADSLLAIADVADDPVLFLWTGRKEPFEAGGIQPYERVRQRTPLYYDPGRCMDAVASLVGAARTPADAPGARRARLRTRRRPERRSRRPRRGRGRRRPRPPVGRRARGRKPPSCSTRSGSTCTRPRSRPTRARQ